MNNNVSTVTDFTRELQSLVALLEKIEIDRCDAIFNGLFERNLPYYVDEQISYAYDSFLSYNLERSAKIIKNLLTHLGYYL